VELEEKNEIFRVGVENFLEALADGSLPLQAKGRPIIVQGSVDLRAHPLAPVITEIPEVAITGDLAADNSCALRICRCKVAGSVTMDGSWIEEFTAPSDHAGSVGGIFSAKDCPNLRKVSGKFNNDVYLSGSSIAEVLTDFVSTGELYLKGCMNLCRVDCSAWSIIADESSLREVGPSTAAENFSAQNCASLEAAFPISGLEWAKYNGSAVREVPASFLCDGPVYFNGCKKLRVLSGRMSKVEVSRSPLEEISSLEAEEIIFSECEKIPANMTRVKAKALIFDQCNIKKFPAGIPENASVRIGACPEFYKLPVVWGGGISLTGLPSFEATPVGFRCAGNFDAEDCPNLTRLRGRIGGDLWLLSGLGRLYELGSDLEVAGDLTLSGLTEVKKLDCKVGRDVVAGRAQINETGPKFSVGGDVDLHGCKKLVVVRGKVSGMTMLDDSSVTALGADFECGGDLCLRSAPRLISLNCRVGGRVLANNSSLRKTGPAFQCAKSLNINGCRHFQLSEGKVGGRTIRDRLVNKKEGEGGEVHPVTQIKVRPSIARTLSPHASSKPADRQR